MKAKDKAKESPAVEAAQATPEAPAAPVQAESAPQVDQNPPAEPPAVGEDRLIDPKTGLRNDGPTLEQYVAAGYDPKTYPPAGYTDKRVAAKPQPKRGPFGFVVVHDPAKSGIGFGHAK